VTAPASLGRTLPGHKALLRRPLQLNTHQLRLSSVRAAVRVRRPVTTKPIETWSRGTDGETRFTMPAFGTPAAIAADLRCRTTTGKAVFIRLHFG
jgi:hypothetical protein